MLVRKKSDICPQKATLMGSQKATIGEGLSRGLQIFAQIHAENKVFACLVHNTVNTAYVQGFLIFNVSSIAGSNMQVGRLLVVSPPSKSHLPDKAH
jgi:hypothetical protein